MAVSAIFQQICFLRAIRTGIQVFFEKKQSLSIWTNFIRYKHLLQPSVTTTSFTWLIASYQLPPITVYVWAGAGDEIASHCPQRMQLLARLLGETTWAYSFLIFVCIWESLGIVEY